MNTELPIEPGASSPPPLAEPAGMDNEQLAEAAELERHLGQLKKRVEEDMTGKLFRQLKAGGALVGMTEKEIGLELDSANTTRAEFQSMYKIWLARAKPGNLK